MMLGDQAQIAVLSGEVEFENNGQIARIKKNDTVTVDSTNPAGMVMVKGVDSLPLDRWNNERAAYQNAYSYNNNGLGTKSMSGSGYSDLAYYGCVHVGSGLWNGVAAVRRIQLGRMGSVYVWWHGLYAPGLGYSWASAYPWGWMPYSLRIVGLHDGNGLVLVPGQLRLITAVSSRIGRRPRPW